MIDTSGQACHKTKESRNLPNEAVAPISLERRIVRTLLSCSSRLSPMIAAQMSKRPASSQISRRTSIAVAPSGCSWTRTISASMKRGPSRLRVRVRHKSLPKMAGTVGANLILALPAQYLHVSGLGSSYQWSMQKFPDVAGAGRGGGAGESSPVLALAESGARSSPRF